MRSAGGAPILLENKRGLAKRRLLQLLLGCPKLAPLGTPFYMVLWQVFLFCIPAVVIIPFSLALDNAGMNHVVGSVLAGLLLMILAGSVYGFSHFKRKESNSGNITDITKHKSANTFSEEDDVFFTGCCQYEAINFVVPLHVLSTVTGLQTVMYGLVGSCSMLYLLPSRLQNVFNNNDDAVMVVGAFKLFLIVHEYSND